MRDRQRHAVHLVGQDRLGLPRGLQVDDLVIGLAALLVPLVGVEDQVAGLRRRACTGRGRPTRGRPPSGRSAVQPWMQWCIVVCS